MRNRRAHLPLRGWRQRVPRTRPPLRANRRTCDDDRRPGRSSECACRFAAHSDQRLALPPADSPRLLGLSSLMSVPCSGRQGLRPLAPPLLTGAAHQLTFAGYAGFSRPIERAVRSAPVPSQFGVFSFMNPTFPRASARRSLGALCSRSEYRHFLNRNRRHLESTASVARGLCSVESCSESGAWAQAFLVQSRGHEHNQCESQRITDSDSKGRLRGSHQTDSRYPQRNRDPARPDSPKPARAFQPPTFPQKKESACEFTVFSYGALALLFRSLFPSGDGTGGSAGLPLVPAVWFQSAHRWRRSTPWPPS